MSVVLMGAALERGPRKISVRSALVAIADSADDFGFAVLSIETIANKLPCDPRQAIRLVQSLEREGWMKVRRRVLGGKGNVYFISLGMLRVEPGPKSRRSELVVELERQWKKAHPGKSFLPEEEERQRQKPTTDDTDQSADKSSKSGDKLSCVNGGNNNSAPTDSGDISQGVQVTFSTDSGDISGDCILKNRLNRLNPDKAKAITLPGCGRVQEEIADASPELTADEVRAIAQAGVQPVSAGERAAWDGVVKDLRVGLTQDTRVRGKGRPAHLRDGFADFKRCFDSMVLVRVDLANGGNARLVVRADDAAGANFGLRTYSGRVAKAVQKYFGRVMPVQLEVTTDSS